jgi:tetratricopeptide (TPR) repeat protein
MANETHVPRLACSRIGDIPLARFAAPTAMPVIADSAIDVGSGSNVGDIAEGLVRQEIAASEVCAAAQALNGEHLIAFVSERSSCALARALIRHLEENVGTLSLDRYLEIATAAVTVSERVAPYGIATRTRAWQKQGTALARKFLFRDAFRTFDVAERHARNTVIPRYYSALVNYARACAYSDQCRGDKASALLPGLHETFVEYGDSAAARGVLKLHAFVSFNLGQYCDALAGWLALLPTVEATGSEYEIAIHRKNIGQCYMKLGDESSAQQYFSRALPALSRFGQMDTVARIHRELARSALTRGDRRAVGDLRRAAQTFYDAGCAGEYLVTRLDVIAAQLTMNPTAVVRREIAGLAQHARACGLEAYLVARLGELETLAAEKRLVASDVLAVAEDINPELRMHAN